MPISDAYSTEKDVFYTDRYKTLVRSQKETLLKTAQQIPILDRAQLHAYRTDVYRVLRSLKVPPHLYWTTAFINGLENPDADVSGLKFIYSVQENVLEKMISRSNTQRG